MGYCPSIPKWNNILQQGNGFELLMGYGENYKLIFFYANRNMKSDYSVLSKTVRLGTV